MAEINYGQLADAIVDAIQRTRAVGQADDPLSILVNSLTGSIEKYTARLEDMPKAQQDLESALQGVKLVVNQLGKSVVRLSQEVILLQRQGLAFNKDFTQTLKQSGMVLSDLPGGLRESLESLFQFQHSGMMNAGKATLGLANTMRITGQNVRALVKMDKMLLTQGLVGGQDRERLIDTLGRTGRSYGVAAGTLVEAVNALSKSMSLLGLTGGADAMATEIAKFVAMSPAVGENATNFVNAIMSAVESKDMGGIMTLGIKDEVDRWLVGAGDIESVMSKAAAAQLDMMGVFGEHGAEFVGQQVAFAGGIGALATTLEKSVALSEKQGQGKTASQLLADFATSFNTAIAPFQEELGLLVTTLATWLGKAVGALTAFTGVKPLLITLIGVVLRKIILGGAAIVRGMGVLTMALNRNASIRAAGAASRGAGAAGLAARGGFLNPWVIAAGVIIAGMPMLINSLTKSEELEKKQLAMMEKTYDSMEFSRKELGGSRFEEVSKMLINQSMQAAGAAKAAHLEAFGSANQRLVEGNDDILAALNRGLPGRPEPSIRSSDPEQGVT